MGLPLHFFPAYMLWQPDQIITKRRHNKNLKWTRLCLGLIKTCLEAFLCFLGKTKMKAFTKLTIFLYCCQIVNRKSIAPYSGNIRRRQAPTGAAVGLWTRSFYERGQQGQGQGCKKKTNVNGNLVQPTQKPLYSAYLLNEYCIFRKISSNTLGLGANFPVHHKSQWCFKKRNMLKTKKIRVIFSIGDLPLPSKPVKQPKNLILTIPWGTPPPTGARVRQRPQKCHISCFTKKKIVKIHDLVHRPTAAPVAAVNRR